MKDYYVYILTNKSLTLYIGFTDNIKRRLTQHRNKSIAGFSSKYNVCKLIYIERYTEKYVALIRERQFKKWSRRKKLYLISKVNPKFKEITLS